MNDRMQKTAIAQSTETRKSHSKLRFYQNAFNFYFLGTKLLNNFAFFVLKHMLILFLYINHEFNHKFKSKSVKEVKWR